MTDPRQTSRDSATSARRKTFRDRPTELDPTPWTRITIESGQPPPIVAPVPKRQLITGHGIGWLIGVGVGLATLWAVFFNGGHL